VDGGWRSHRHRYTDNSGVGCVFGLLIKMKLLYVGVLNKYCYILQYLLKINKPIKHDSCFENWDYNSPGKEFDMIVEAFKCSFEMHKVEDRYMIGNVDSSVYVKVKENSIWKKRNQKRMC